MSELFKYLHEYDDSLYYHAADTTPEDITMHTHDICELLFVKKGNLTYNVEGKSYHLTRNCLVRTRPFERHNLIFNSCAEYERYILVFNEKKIHPDLYTQIPVELDVVNFDSNALVCNLFQKLDYYFSILNPKEFQLILHNVILELMYHLRLSAHENDSDHVHIANTLVNDAVQYINANILTSLSLDDICAEIHITKSYLHQLFIKHLQISPGQYILSKKLAIARKNLRMGFKATDVYLACGFTDYSAFYRAYMKQFGHSPSEEINTPIIHEIYY